MSPGAAISSPEKSLKRMRRALGLFVLLLAVPIAALLMMLASRLKGEETNRLGTEAARVANLLQSEIQAFFDREDRRRFEDYSFFNVASNALFKSQAGVSFSSLSTLKPEGGFPEALGYFQVNPDGSLQTPLLPDLRKVGFAEIRSLIGEEELTKRLQVKSVLERRLRELQSFIPRSRAESSPSRDQESGEASKNIGKRLRDAQSQQIRVPSQALIPYVKNQLDLSNTSVANIQNQLQLPPENVQDETSKIQPVELHPLSDGTLALTRLAQVGRDRYLQGFLVGTDTLFTKLFREPFEAHQLGERFSIRVSGPNRKTMILQSSESIASSSLPSPRETEVYHVRLEAPLQEFSMTFFARGSSMGLSGRLVIVLGVSLAFILVAGALALYSVGKSQIRLAEERGNFVSAVSHELKTPLTSIRMYAEMLDSDIPQSEEKRRSYYRYILTESERLSRLVGNVLLLSRIENQPAPVTLESCNAQTLVNGAAERLRSHIEASGFVLAVIGSETPLPNILVDKDAFLQIITNLVENSLKFSAAAPRKEIELGARTGPAGTVSFFVRDFGPGVPPKEIKKIFRLFYRVENELTRNTKGTGLGLGLVTALAKQMHAELEGKAREPGLEVVLTFKAAGTEK